MLPRITPRRPRVDAVRLSGLWLALFAALPAAPEIVLQPETTAVPLGAAASLEVGVAGVDQCSYQWRFNGVAIPGATRARHDINAFATANVGAYSVAVSDGTSTVESASAWLLSASGYTFIPWVGRLYVSGLVDGPRDQARFRRPEGIVADAHNNLFVTDANAVRKIDPNGVVSTLAGKPGESGSVDGPPAVARFSHAGHLTIDRAGNLYVQDEHAVRKVTPDGTTSTLLVSIVPAVASVAVDADGNYLLVGGSMVRKMTPEGVITTLAGGYSSGTKDGIGPEAQFDGASGAVLGADGTLFVLDSNVTTIRTVSRDGVVKTIAGWPGLYDSVDGKGSDARFNGYYANLAIDANGLLYLPASALRTISPEGDVKTAGAWDVGFTSAVAVAPGGVYLASSNARAVLKRVHAAAPLIWAQPVNCEVKANQTAEFSVGAVSLPAPKYAWQLNSYADVWQDLAEDELFQGVNTSRLRVKVTADNSANLSRSRFRCTVTAFSHAPVPSESATLTVKGVAATQPVDDMTGWFTFERVAGTVQEGGYVDGSAPQSKFRYTLGVAVDRDGTIYVADTAAGAIRKISKQGVVSTYAGADMGPGGDGAAAKDGPAAGARFRRPGAIAIGPNRELYVRDGYAIRRISSDGNVTTLAGSADEWGHADGVGAAARFDSAGGIAVDRWGNVFITDVNSVVKITPDGNATTLAGHHSGGVYSWGTDDGPGISATFGVLSDLVTDLNGNVYVADARTHLIRKITPNGEVSTVAGVRKTPGSKDGPAGAATLDTPQAMAIDERGVLYVCQQNDLIRAVLPDGSIQTIGGKPNARGATDGVGTAAQFNQPSAIAVGPEGELIIADTMNFTIRRGSLRPARLVNLSTRAFVGTGANIQIAGFVISGPSAKQVLIRAAGPALAGQLGNVLPAPVLDVYAGQTKIASNAGWGTATNSAEVEAAAKRLGAFAFPRTSKDSALLLTLSPGAYTALVKDAEGRSGVCLVEVYDADTGPSRLVNVATRSWVGKGGNVQIAGLVIAGDRSKRLLVRASGPALRLLQLDGVVPNPTVTLYSGATPQLKNAGWGNSPRSREIERASQRLSAFGWPQESPDSAALALFSPGAYTAIVEDLGEQEGIGLVEVYDAD